jgi:hypothetical protein
MQSPIPRFFTFFKIISGSTTYLYGYSSDVSVHSDERISSHKLTVSLECDVSVTLVWSPNNNQAEKIVRFKVKNCIFKTSYENLTSWEWW